MINLLPIKYRFVSSVDRTVRNKIWRVLYLCRLPAHQIAWICCFFALQLLDRSRRWSSVFRGGEEQLVVPDHHRHHLLDHRGSCESVCVVSLSNISHLVQKESKHKNVTAEEFDKSNATVSQSWTFSYKAREKKTAILQDQDGERLVWNIKNVWNIRNIWLLLIVTCRR